MTRQAQPTRQSGFTLTEILIAVAILGMISMLSFGSIRGSVDASERAQKVTDRYHQIRQALARMSREIQSAYLSEHRNCDDPQNKTIFLGKRSSNGMRLDYTSFSHFKIQTDANESDQNELSYFVDSHPDDSSRKALFRREEVRIDEDPEEGGVEKVMAEDVVNLEFEFYDPDDKEWVDEWDSNGMDYKSKLPAYVKVVMTALDPQGREVDYTTKTRLFLRKSISIVGISGAPCLD